jgi:hypothetical protein
MWSNKNHEQERPRMTLIYAARAAEGVEKRKNLTTTSLSEKSKFTILLSRLAFGP